MPPTRSLARLLHPLLPAVHNASANALMRGARIVPRRAVLPPLVARFNASPSVALKKHSPKKHSPKQHQMPPRPKPPPDSEIQESYLKGSGPGGQKINKTSSAVQLKHIPTGIVVKSQATRSRSQNRKIARGLLAQKVDDLVNGDQSRSAIVAHLKRKIAARAAKKSRRKYRKLEEEKQKNQDGDAEAEAEADPLGRQAEQETNNAPSVEVKP